MAGYAPGGQAFDFLASRREIAGMVPSNASCFRSLY